MAFAASGSAFEIAAAQVPVDLHLADHGFTAGELARVFEVDVEQAGSQSAWACRTRIQTLNRVMRGRVLPAPEFIGALGLKATVL
jgi:hypothetical protein